MLDRINIYIFIQYVGYINPNPTGQNATFNLPQRKEGGGRFLTSLIFGLLINNKMGQILEREKY